MKIKILYEDSNILAIDKPSGISVHPDGRTKEKTVTDWVIKNYPKMKNVGESMYIEEKGKKVELKRPGVVHRLDRDTSGVLILAKNQKAYEFLKKSFQDRVMKKTYLAIIDGFMRDDRGVINKAIGRNPRDFRQYSANRGARGEMREATTQYRVLKRFTSAHKKFTYLEVHPRTGRTHQIRVHMKFLSHPVSCDPLYNAEAKGPLGLKRLALHAKSIEFKDMKGETIRIESLMPTDIKKVVGVL